MSFAVRRIAQLKKKRKNIYIFCKANLNRSPSVLAVPTFPFTLISQQHKILIYVWVVPRQESGDGG